MQDHRISPLRKCKLQREVEKEEDNNRFGMEICILHHLAHACLLLFHLFCRLMAHSQWDYVAGETEELALRMKNLNMNQNQRKMSTGTATNNTRLSIDSIASDFSISRNSRQSLENCASNSDFIAHLHGTTTPIPRSRIGRPPRTSLQSVASSTCPPPTMSLKINTSPFLPMHLNCGASIGSAEYTLT